jgi:hypothetical protein
MTDREKAYLLTMALAAFENVRDAEPEKTARRTRLDRGMDRLLELIDVYRPERWPNDLLIMASDLVDEFNLRIKEKFGRPPP